MKTLYKNLNVCFPKHPLHGKTIDVLVNNGRISEIGMALSSEGSHIIKSIDLMLMPSMVDMQCTVGEPGYEQKETIESAAEAGFAGGFSTIVMLPNTNPVVDNKAQLDFIHQKSKNLPCKVLSYGCISKGQKGAELSEMFDMHQHGAVGFNDGKKPISDVSLMKRALEYAKSFDALVCSFPYEDRLNPGAMVHESENNTSLGIKSAPSLAEEMMLARDMALLEYTESRLHVSTISTAGSLKIIKEAKGKGLQLTVGVALANLLYTDRNLNAFETVYKTMPPLREQTDVVELINAINSGEIDVIVTDHCPEIIENKDREFDHAEYGMTMLETALSLINMELSSKINWNTIVLMLSLNPRKILGLDMPKLEKGEPFDFIVFDPNHTWTYDRSMKKSLAENSPVFGKQLKGKVIR